MRLLLTFTLFIIFSSSVFAKSGFEAIFNIPIGLSIGIPMGKIESNIRKPNLGVDFGIIAQMGYMIDFKNEIGLSILGEAGYSYDNYSYSSLLNGNQTDKSSITFHSFQIGLLPKFNIQEYSIGLGFGLKIPLLGYQYSETKISDTSSVINVNKLDIYYITKMYYMNVIPYIKLTFDYSIFSNKNIAANIGLYLDYEFGTREKIDNKYISVDSFDIGIQFGLRLTTS